MRGGRRANAGRKPALSIEQELWIEARAKELWRDTWMKRQGRTQPNVTERAPIKWVGDESGVRSGQSVAGVPAQTIIGWMRFAEEKPAVRSSVIENVAREASERWGIKVSPDMVERVLAAARLPD